MKGSRLRRVSTGGTRLAHDCYVQLLLGKGDSIREKKITSILDAVGVEKRIHGHEYPLQVDRLEGWGGGEEGRRIVKTIQ